MELTSLSSILVWNGNQWRAWKRGFAWCRGCRVRLSSLSLSQSPGQSVGFHRVPASQGVIPSLPRCHLKTTNKTANFLLSSFCTDMWKDFEKFETFLSSFCTDMWKDFEKFETFLSSFCTNMWKDFYQNVQLMMGGFMSSDVFGCKKRTALKVDVL